MEITKQLITPEIAKKYLEGNVSNRNINKYTVMRYANDMISGRWKENTFETIKISKTGRVLDAQHRLHAVIKSNKSIWFHVVTGMEDDVFDVLDTGSLRSPKDVFKIKGVMNANSIPSMISFYNLLKSNKKRGQQKHSKSTNSMLLEQFFLNEQRWNEVGRKTYGFYLSFLKVLPPSIIGAFYYFLTEIDNEKGESFIKQLVTGDNIENKTILLLRNKLIEDRISIKKMSITTRTAFIIKTWNFFINNEEKKRLVYDPLKEEYPLFSKF